MGIWTALSKCHLTIFNILLQPNVCRREVIENLKDLPFAPSVQMQDVPGMSIADVLSRKRPDVQEEDEDRDLALDRRIRSNSSNKFPYSSTYNCIPDYVASIQEGARDDMDLDVDDPNNDAISQASSEADEMDYVQGYVYSNGYPEGRSGISFPRREKRKFFRSSLKFHDFQDIRLMGELNE